MNLLRACLLLWGLLQACKIRRFSESLAYKSKGRIKSVSINNTTWQTRATLVNINFDKTIYYRFIVSVNKCDESWNIIDDPYGWIFVQNKAEIWMQKYLI